MNTVWPAREVNSKLVDLQARLHWPSKWAEQAIATLLEEIKTWSMRLQALNDRQIFQERVRENLRRSRLNGSVKDFVGLVNDIAVPRPDGRITACFPTPYLKAISKRLFCYESQASKMVNEAEALAIIRYQPFDGGQAFEVADGGIWKCEFYVLEEEAIKNATELKAFGETQTIFSFPGAQFAVRSTSQFNKSTESQTKTGEARPSMSSKIVNSDPPACATDGGKERSPPSATSQIVNSEQGLLRPNSFSSSKLSTAEALKLLRAGEKGIAEKHVLDLSIADKEAFCRAIELSATMAKLRRDVSEFVGAETMKGWGGKWTNCVKLDESAVGRALWDLKQPNAPKPKKTRGTQLNDLVLRFSPVLSAWYPKLKAEDEDEC